MNAECRISSIWSHAARLSASPSRGGSHGAPTTSIGGERTGWAGSNGVERMVGPPVGDVDSPPGGTRMTSWRHRTASETTHGKSSSGWKHPFASLRIAGILIPWTIVLPAGSAIAAPPQLTVRKAQTLAVRAISDYGLTPKITKRACRRATTLAFRCTMRWADGGDRYTAVVRISRTGLETSPVDYYSLAGRKYDEFDGTSRIREEGRFVVETRRAYLGQTLRLWVDGGQQIDATIGPPEIVLPVNGSAPPAGWQWVTYQITVTNSGSGRWERGDYGLQMLSGDGVVIQSSYDAAAAAGCGPLVSSAPGEVRSSCIAFEVRDGDLQAASLQWDAGVETGVWTE